MPYQPIENYAMIGDMHTVALVGINGSIDWLCIPHFDSPSVFGAILDDKKAGRFSIAPVGDMVTYKQFYWPETNVLITRFLAPHGAAELTDFMPISTASPSGQHNHQLIRRVAAVRGSIEFDMECLPAFNYARDRHTTNIADEGVTFESPSLSLGLTAHTSLEKKGNGVISRFTLKEGEAAVFVLREVQPGTGCGACMFEEEAELMFRQTVAYWRRWLSRCKYKGRWREIVHRCDSSSPYRQPARRNRWGTELGLPLHLDPGFRVYHLCVHAAWIYRRGGEIHAFSHRHHYST
jgi:GH15 family glucan-1,4-alpha-glucosidase